MQDILFILVIIGFFLAAIAYVAACEALGKRREDK